MITHLEFYQKIILKHKIGQVPHRLNKQMKTWKLNYLHKYFIQSYATDKNFHKDNQSLYKIDIMLGLIIKKFLIWLHK
jgi:hypothetical protein